MCGIAEFLENTEDAEKAAASRFFVKNNHYPYQDVLLWVSFPCIPRFCLNQDLQITKITLNRSNSKR